MSRHSFFRITTLLFGFTLTVNAQALRFALVSDTHVGTTTGADDLRATVSDINSRRDIEFTLVSGDVTEMGSDAELSTAKAILDSLRCPLLIIPGNHDTKWSESGCTTFSRLFGNDRFAVDRGAWRFIGIHEGPIMRMGDGHFAPEDVRWLDSVVTSTPSSKPVVFVTHYPLDNSIDNFEEVVRRLRRLNIKAVLCGHGHSNRVLSFDGIPGIMCRSNLRAKEPAGGYSVVSLGPDSIVVSERKPGGHDSLWAHIASGTAPTVPPAGQPDTSFRAVRGDIERHWVFRSGYTITASPVVTGGRIIIGDRSGRVLCLAADDGRILWELRAGGAVLSTACVSDGRVVFASVDGNISCARISDGAIVWNFATPRPIVAAPAISDGVVYIGASDGVFRALNLGTGVLRWEYRGIDGFVETRPLVYNGIVVFGAWDTRLYALRLLDGRLAWTWSNGSPSLLYSPAACWPVASEGRIYIVAPDRVMTAIDAANGATIWRSAAHQTRETIGISEDGTRVYARCITDTLLAFSAAGTTPTLSWVRTCGYGYDIDPSMPVEHEDRVSFGTKNGLVISVQGTTGELLWIAKVGVTIVNTPAALDGNRVVVTDADGAVTMLGPSVR